MPIFGEAIFYCLMNIGNDLLIGGIESLALHRLMNRLETKRYVLSVTTVSSLESCHQGMR